MIFFVILVDFCQIIVDSHPLQVYIRFHVVRSDASMTFGTDIIISERLQFAGALFICPRNLLLTGYQSSPVTDTRGRFILSEDHVWISRR